MSRLASHADGATDGLVAVNGEKIIELEQITQWHSISFYLSPFTFYLLPFIRYLLPFIFYPLPFTFTLHRIKISFYLFPLTSSSLLHRFLSSQPLPIRGVCAAGSDRVSRNIAAVARFVLLVLQLVAHNLELRLALALALVVGERLAPDLLALAQALLRHRALVFVFSQLVSQFVERSRLLVSGFELNYPGVPRSGTFVRAVALTGVQLSQHIVDSVPRPLHRIARCIFDRSVVRRSTGDLLARVRVRCFAEPDHSVPVELLRGSPEPPLRSESVRFKTGERVKLLRNLICLDCMLV